MFEKAIYIEWLDSAGSEGGWEDKKDIVGYESLECRSVGFLVENTDKGMTIALSENDGQVYAVKSIPHVCIKRSQIIMLGSI